ncbi:competence protein ComK [Lederbergia panacisoli]|uniref:competence protein ComK n=1 Tax=Lederbergia panacisoli TaxID=1255251 RepID=UPI00214C4191|nr:competence protein ComK [Lederbergia panacisoli]MCR2823803.1 competence protein ComK [Lederbergia panacisoli]
MKIKKRYIINRFTIALMGVYVKNGYFYSSVLEGEKVFLVKLSPIEIIENSLIHYGGGDFNGAKKATRAAIGNYDMPPIKISGSLGIYWFPSKSPTNKDCIWFSLNNIKDSIPVEHNKTKILLQFGHTITLTIRKSVFKTRKYRTRDLKDTIEKRTDPTLIYTYDPYKNTDIVIENQTSYHFEQNEDGIVEITNDVDMVSKI